MPSTGTPAGRVPRDRAGEAGRAQPVEIGERCSWSRDHDRGGAVDLGRARARSARAAPSGANSSRFAMRGSATIAICAVAPDGALQGDAVLLGRAARRVHGTTPSVGTPVRSSSHSGPGASSAASPRKRLSRKPGERAFARLATQALPGAEQVRERAAPVDVAAQQHGRCDLERDCHVHDVAVAQVDLGRAARALDHDDVVVVHQAVQRRAHDAARGARGARARAAPRARGRPRRARPPASACRPPA